MVMIEDELSRERCRRLIWSSIHCQEVFSGHKQETCPALSVAFQHGFLSTGIWQGVICGCSLRTWNFFLKNVGLFN